jgi:hypothetical protein
VELFRALAATYLIATLSATSLAKLKNWRMSSVGVLRESVIPSRAATVTVLAVSGTEFLLASFLAFGAESVAAGVVVASLFLVFGGYRLAVAKRTNSLICSCAGTIRSDPASPPAVAGTVVACLLQAALACAFALSGGRPNKDPLDILATAALALPIIIFLAGLLRRSDQSVIGGKFPAEFASLSYYFGNTASRSVSELSRRR